MANKKPNKRVTTEFVDGDGEDTRTPEGFAFDPAEESFSQFRSKFGTEGVLVKIYRRTPRGVQYCFSGVPSEIDEEVVRLYHSRQPYASEEGQYAARCFVNGEGRDSFPILIGPQVAQPGDMQHGGMANGTDMILKMLMDQNARLEAQLLRQSGQVEREPITALADAMLKLSQMQQQNQAKEMPIDTLLKCIELGKGLNNDGDWKTTLLEVVKETMPTIGQIMNTPKTNDQKALPNTSGAPSGTVPSSAEALTEQLKGGLGWLKRKAISGGDPGLYIDWIIDNREQSPYAELIHAVVGQPFSSFVQLDAEIGRQPYHAFFLALYDGIRSAFSEGSSEDEKIVDTAGTGGNKANAPGHGGTGKAGAKR